MLKTDANPHRIPIEAVDAIRHGVAGDRSRCSQDLSTPVSGANRPGASVSQGVRDSLWRWSMPVGLKGAYATHKDQFNTDLFDLLGTRAPAPPDPAPSTRPAGHEMGRPAVTGRRPGRDTP